MSDSVAQTTTDSDALNLKVSGIVQLKPQGTDSNYLDWSFVVLLHLQSLKLAYVLKPEDATTIEPKTTTAAAKSRPSSWANDSIAVSSFIARTIHPSNLRFVRAHGTNAAAMWVSLSQAHQDFSSGGRMHWLRQLVVARLSGDDIESHIEAMAICAERLGSLVTPEKPLTVDDIHATALLTSLTDDWLPCVSALMNEDAVTSSRIVSALKAESLRRKARCDDESSVSVSKARAEPDKGRLRYNKALHCTFCNRSGHDLTVCQNAARILSDHKSSRSSAPDSSRRNDGSRFKGRSNASDRSPPQPPGHTTVVELGYDSYEDDSDFSIPERAGNAVVGLTSFPSSVSTNTVDANIDSGCSVSMTPHISTVHRCKPDSTVVRLADSSEVLATHRGSQSLPLSVDKSVPTLVVPGLHEPLLSVAGLCDKNLIVVFSAEACEFYEAGSFSSSGPIVGRGYRKGNLFYLPSNEVRSSSAVSTPSPSHGNSLLDFHIRLSHIGLKPLKRLLRQAGIVPTLANDIEHDQKGISLDTATRWMYKLGFRAQRHRKSVYYDGHEREDVVASRLKFLGDVARLRAYSKKYDGDNCDIPLLVDPEILGDNKETVFIYHDESTIHAKERPTLSWLLPGTTELRSKSLGRLIHISDFILESTGRLVLSPEQQKLHDLEFSDAATVIYPGSQGDAWWDMDQLCKQVSQKAIPIFEAAHPDCQGVFIFDCSLAHEAFGPHALRAQKMNLGPGGKQSRLRDTIIPSDNPHIPEELRGQPQTMCYPTDHPDPSLAGQPKGIKQVLTERGLWQHYCSSRIQARLPPLVLKCKTCLESGAVKEAEARASQLVKQAEAQGYFIDQEACFTKELGTTAPANLPQSKLKDCCWSQIMTSQSDFLAERSLLQTMIEDAGHICLFLPKFHCELNPIELLWAYVKADYRRQSHQCSTWKHYQALFEHSRRSCPLSTIRKFFRKIDRQHSAYALGLDGPAAQRAMKKYSSHRRIPKSAMMDLSIVGA
ncbi:uncharacterized protein PGTG_20589 [Puccinia graminis f. sp. tritici CRL 75-36-700-3]|uniref:Tc1-like transposase DDE domain-containing protein n=1 Tax=Puccinia graminis f. sp. tritici (strain CRL 75-36-700-3 / race SCCL) TaxID=418459 RepID=H6QNY5_PUCGT|nr:uncharacterized protein PGTG_20589 [Puccinia graminis f. sp. tritici CRL 75-36-700-3]EHS62464.1 hypothetical protein PGTG_20589 [Puccinia graminis f. sp. tritici CRL 75-36-700-3]